MSGMTHCDVVALNGGNRIMSNGAPRKRVMPNGCMETPVFFLAPDLDRGFFMDAAHSFPWRSFSEESKNQNRGESDTKIGGKKISAG